ncbi:alpha-ketoglutarate decarboxylase [Glaciihabitans arcticus]|uniref:Alpha-ketoglutarate decarboxylase n=1 Tax=Glaciihabitans arcticus TaxID=2668039 RepID=A0A4Q9GT23_9MICO|nr:zf-HC2 domain-containing protein [Glaciihabitans arcticus]TBN56247.1 alpha-ketoglutarate decarboxylase [Glaciihabitans arcticus]
MTDCGCDKAKAELEEYIHNELTVGEAADIAEHMATCEDCSGEHLVGLTLTLKVKQACNEKAPEDLRSAILSKLSEVSA